MERVKVFDIFNSFTSSVCKYGSMDVYIQFTHYQGSTNIYIFFFFSSLFGTTRPFQGLTLILKLLFFRYVVFKILIYISQVQVQGRLIEKGRKVSFLKYIFQNCRCKFEIMYIININRVCNIHNICECIFIIDLPRFLE